MPFSSLEQRIGDLPLVICGPIVRQVDDQSATIWLALKNEVKSIELRIFKDSGGKIADQNPVARGIQDTLSFGQHLHFVAITAKLVDTNEPMKWGQSYLYDLDFGIHGNSLKADGVLDHITHYLYHDNELPGFMLAPEKIADLHVIHGSCRKPHSTGQDAMQALDNILERDWKTSRRPQLAFLTGDQIYADEVDNTLLKMLMDATRFLMGGPTGWLEQFPDGINEQHQDRLVPGKRGELVREEARFTTTSGGGHLLSLGEYLTMYLFIWSESLWPQPESEPDKANISHYPYPDKLQVYLEHNGISIPENARALLLKLINLEKYSLSPIELERLNDLFFEENPLENDNAALNAIEALLEGGPQAQAIPVLEGILQKANAKEIQLKDQTVEALLKLTERGRNHLSPAQFDTLKIYLEDDTNGLPDAEKLLFLALLRKVRLLNGEKQVLHKLFSDGKDELDREEKELVRELIDAPTGALFGLDKTLIERELEGSEQAPSEQEFELKKLLKGIFSGRLPGELNTLLSRLKSYEKNKFRLVHFQQSLRKTRRALANIATFMVFDDHEVTDDWHLNRDWVEEAYPKAFARRILMNGLASFAVCQAWGNTPQRFNEEKINNSSSPEFVLLRAIEAWVRQECNDPVSERTILKSFNIPHDEAGINELIEKVRKGNLPKGEHLVKWHFDYQHPKFQVIFTDARTQRSFPGKRYQASEHLSDEAIIEQIPLTTAQPELNFLISPCNLVTINYFRNWGARYLLPIFPIAQLIGKGSKVADRAHLLVNNPDLADSWVLLSPAFENVISRLATRGPIENGRRRSRWVVLSGDVHFSAVMRYQYWADKPFRIYIDDPVKDGKANMPKSSPSEMVLAHLTCSGFKNEVGIWELLHYLGYELSDLLDKKEQLPVPEVILGFHKKDQFDEEKKKEILLNTRWFPNYRPSLTLREPVMIPFHERDALIKYPKPDWYYRIDAVRGHRQEAAARDQQENVIEADDGIFATVGKALHNHLVYSRHDSAGLEIIWINTLASVETKWTGEGKLAKELSKGQKELEVEVDKSFPAAPFTVIIGEELLYVKETEDLNPPNLRFKSLIRGADNTKAADHTKSTKVLIRKSIVQTYWIVVDEDQQGERNKEKELVTETEKPFTQKVKAYTQFSVSMEFDDVKLKEPELPLLENA